MDKFTLFSGIEVPIPELGIILRHPTLRDIAYIGEENFFKILNLLNIDKNIFINNINKEKFETEEEYLEYKNLWENLNQFETLLAVLLISSKEEKEQIIEDITTFLNMILSTNYSISFEEEEIILIKEDKVLIIRSNEYNILLQYINILCCWDHFTSNTSNKEFDPLDDKAREIVEKIKKGRERVNKNNKDNKDISIFKNYLKKLNVGLGLAYGQLLDFTVYQAVESMKDLQAKILYEDEMRAIVAGAKPSENFKHWLQPD